jgi:hypothetical protein
LLAGVLGNKQIIEVPPDSTAKALFSSETLTLNRF